MKVIHKIGIMATVISSLGLFSFTQAKASNNDYQVINHISSKAFKVAGFDRYQESKYLSNQTTWNYRYQTWSLADNQSDISSIEKVLDK